MILLLACSVSDTGGPGPKGAVDTGDPVDTADSADTEDTVDTVDTEETGDTGGETAAPTSTDDADLVISGTTTDQVGRSIEVDDADGDGADDLLFGALGMATGAGGAWVLTGPVLEGGRLDGIAVALQGSSGLGSYVGRTVAFGDVDGDGLADALLGSPYANESVFLCAGPFPGDRSLADATTRILGDPGSLLGHGLDVGDVTGDGNVDLVVGAYAAEGMAINGGAVYLVPGPIPAGEHDIDELAVATDFGLTPDSAFGRFVRVGGDVNGDGLADILIAEPWAKGGAPGSGVVHLVYGGWTGDRDASDSDARLLGEGPNEVAGEELGFGDLDQDGVDEVIVGAFGAAGGDKPGAAYILSGPAGEVALGDAGVIVRGDVASARVGASVAIGDGNGDGVMDLLVGASGLGGGGAAMLYWGPAAGELTVDDAAETFLGAKTGMYTGEAVRFHDLEGDGEVEALIGAYMTDGSAGAVFGFHL